MKHFNACIFIAPVVLFTVCLFIAACAFAESNGRLSSHFAFKSSTHAFDYTDVTIKEEGAVDSNKGYSKVYTSVEHMPEYPGGDAALLEDLRMNIRYPSVAQENGIEGKVVVQFVVTKDGTVGEVKVVRGKDPDLDKEARRVVRTLKPFVPGKMNGEPVDVWYTIPITFKLPKQQIENDSHVGVRCE